MNRMIVNYLYILYFEFRGKKMKAIWNDIVLAESDDIEEVEGNIYFPPESLKKDYFSESNQHTVCVWKGVASYYNIETWNKQIDNAAWYYHEPSKEAERIKDYVAFYPQVKIVE